MFCRSGGRAGAVLEGEGDPRLGKIGAINFPPPLHLQANISDGGRWIPFTFEADTGAAPTSIPISFYNKALAHLPLQAPPGTLRNYDGSVILGVLGMVDTKIYHGGRLHRGDVLVTEDHLPAVLGRDFLCPLQIIITCSAANNIQGETTTQKGLTGTTTTGTAARTTTTSSASAADVLKPYPRLLDPSLGTFPNTSITSGPKRPFLVHTGYGQYLSRAGKQ